MSNARKSNEQRISEAAEGGIDAVLNNTPPKRGRNSDYSPDSAKALMLYIERNILDTRDITMEPAFCDIFLNKAPPLDLDQRRKLEASLGFTFNGFANEILNATSEKDMYKPIARLLSGLTLLVEVDDSVRCLSLPEDRLWMTVIFATRAPQATTDHPGHICDLGSVPETTDTIRQFVKSGEYPSTIHDWGSMGYVGEAKLRNLPTKDSNITIQEKAQTISYIWSCSRHQVHRSGFLALYACRNGLQFVWYGVSKVRISPGYGWGDLQTLFSFVYALHRRENMLEDTRLRLFRHQNCLVPSVLPWHGKDYKPTTFFLGDGWRCKRFIAGGYSPDCEVAVVKLVWRQSGRRFNEARVCEKVHNDGLVAGIVSLLGDDHSSPRVYEIVPGETVSDETYIREMLVYDTIGESLSSCGSVKTFLIAMFDVIEVLRFISTKLHMLHRDVSWSNIILNPCRISGTPKTLAKEQPASFAKFMDPFNRETAQNCDVHNVVTQNLGTAALLDLELAVKLNPTEGARDGVDITGTPMFIAMDWTHYRRKKYFSDMFLNQYRQFFETSPEKSAPESWISFWEEAVQFMRSGVNTDPPAPMELPLHDVESVFWVVVLFFIRASPSNAKEEEMSEDDMRRRSTAFRTLSSNSIGEDDLRKTLLTYSDEDWCKALHPKLRRFAPMLVAMASYFEITWHFIPHTKGEKNIHGHEAMRRILWKTIQDMDMDIPINKEPAIVIIPDASRYYTMNTPTRTNRKRKKNEYQDIAPEKNIPPSGKGKRARVGSSTPFEDPSTRDKDLSQLLGKIRDSHQDGKRWLQSTDVSYAGLELCSGL